jgi:hypothetical protein
MYMAGGVAITPGARRGAMRRRRHKSMRFIVMLALAMLGAVPGAGSQQLPFALAAKHNISLNSISNVIDSFDSNDPSYSTLGLYDAAKRKAGGDVASSDGIIGVRYANIMGTLYTSQAGDYTIGAGGTVGDLAWVLEGGGRRTNGPLPQ